MVERELFDDWFEAIFGVVFRVASALLPGYKMKFIVPGCYIETWLSVYDTLSKSKNRNFCLLISSLFS